MNALSIIESLCAINAQQTVLIEAMSSALAQLGAEDLFSTQVQKLNQDIQSVTGEGGNVS